MPATDDDATRYWRLTCWLTIAGLVLAAVVFVPPGTLPYAPGAAVSDVAIAHWPAARFLRTSVWRDGQWPLWNPLRMLGQPFAANPLNKVWYPPQWLVLLIPTTLHLNLMIYLHLGWLAAGVFRWAREEGLRSETALFMSVAWGAAPKLMAHLGAGHLDIVYALAWVPWLLWGLNRALNGNDNSLSSGARMGVLAALLALADLRVAFYVLPLIAVIGLVRCKRDRGALSCAKVGGIASGIFLLLTAVQLLPLLTLSPYLTRGDITPIEAATFSLPPGYLIGMLIPDVGGFHEWMTYIGIPVLILGVLALLRATRRPEKLVWGAAALLAGLWALGDNGPLFLSVARLLPFVSWVRVPARVWIVVALALTILSAYGLDELLDRGLSVGERLAVVGLIFAGVVWVIGALVMIPDLPVVAATGAALTATGVGLLLLGGEFVGLPVSTQTIGVVVLTGTLAVSLLGLAGSLVEGRPLESVTEHDERIITELLPFCDTVYSPSFELIGPAAAIAEIPTLHGVDPFQLRSSADAIAGAAGVERTFYSVVSPPLPTGQGSEWQTALQDAQLDGSQLAALGVGTVVSRFPLTAERLMHHERVGDVLLYDVQGGMPGILLPGETLTPDEAETHRQCGRPPNRLFLGGWDSIPSNGHGTVTLVLPAAWAPGWKAVLDGQRVPVIPVDGVLVGVQVPALGEHHLRVFYRPLADLVGAAISGMTALVLAGWKVSRSRAKVGGDGE